MPLRCLLFSSNEEMVRPIWQVLTDLGIEGEYCKNAVDAVERVTTQLFQIVITDWADQPEATFLLKTARDLKAAQRPLTLAIVGEDARPQALQAGANSILLKPLRAEQVRDTMSTACELLRAKMQAAAPATPRPVPEDSCHGRSGVVCSDFSSRFCDSGARENPGGRISAIVEFLPRRAIRYGKEVHESVEAPIAEVDALTELEPTAAAVTGSRTKAQQQARTAGTSHWLGIVAGPAHEIGATSQKTSTGSENLLRRYGSPGGASRTGDNSDGNIKFSRRRAATSRIESEAALFAYMAGESKEIPARAQASHARQGKLLVFAPWPLRVWPLVALPRTRQGLQRSSKATRSRDGRLAESASLPPCRRPWPAR